MAFEKKTLVAAIATLVFYTIQETKTEIDDTIIDDLKDALNDYDSNVAIEQNDAEAAAFDILGELAELTPSEADDKIIGIAESIYGLTDGGGMIKRLIEKIRARRAARN